MSVRGDSEYLGGIWHPLLQSIFLEHGESCILPASCIVCHHVTCVCGGFGFFWRCVNAELDNPSLPQKTSWYDTLLDEYHDYPLLVTKSLQFHYLVRPYAITVLLKSDVTNTGYFNNRDFNSRNALSCNSPVLSSSASGNGTATVA